MDTRILFMFASPSKARTAQVQTSSGWVNTSLSQIQPGSRFRMMRPDGTLVAGANGATEFTASRQPAPAPTLRETVREKFSQMLSVRPAAFA